MELFTDGFMLALVGKAGEAASEPVGRVRERQMAALAANILVRLATSELLEHDDQWQAAMLAMRLVVRLRLEVYGPSPAIGGHDPS
jgi:hypothetical protein